MLDNPAANSLKEMLPISMTFEDFNDTEKISFPDVPFTLEGTKRGAAPSKGDILIYEPWGNLCIFYRDGDYSDDLLAVGHIDKGLEILASQDGEFTVVIEPAEQGME